MPIKSNYKNLKVWQKSCDIVVEIYSLTSHLPENEKFGLISQMQRASISIPSNIAEGSKRGGKDFIHFLRIAQGSGAELETQIQIISKIYPKIDTRKLDYISKLLDEVMKMIYGLSKNI